MNSGEYRVLITSSGSKGVPGLIKDLRSSGEKFYIVTVDINPEAIGNLFADKWHVVLPWDDDEYIPAILRIVEKEKIEYVIPNDGPIGLIKLSELSQKSDDLHIAVTEDIEHLSIALNKFKLFSFLHSTDLQKHIPKFCMASDVQSLLKAIIDFDYPKEWVAIKPAVSEGSRGFKIIRDYRRNILEEKADNRHLSYDELTFYLRNLHKIPEVLVMEYLPGEEYSVDVLVNKDRKIEYIVPRVREQVSEGISVKGAIKKNIEVEDLVIKVLQKLRLTYALNIQIKYSKEGTPKIIEINPRVSGTMTFCTGAGVNLHYYLVLLMSDKPLPKVEIKYGTKMYRYYEEKYLYEK